MDENVFLIKAREDAKKKIELFDRTPQIINDIDKEFESQLKLNKMDVCYLFLATALHCLRIYLLNKITMIEKAGNGNKNEDGLHKLQNKIFSNFNSDSNNAISNDYYASLNHIITARGVPYDTQRFCVPQTGQFKGANHRFSTLGHEPILGLVFGTSNIMTNTITFNTFNSNHVIYDEKGKNPQIAMLASTTKMLKKSYERLDNEIEAFVAALIKQMIHIGTDMYTPKGIQLPFIGLALDKSTVEKITKYISFGDFAKTGISLGFSAFINYMIKTIYSLQFERTASNYDIFETKINNIILYAESIAEGSNIIITAMRMAGGDELAIKNLDVGGIINLIHKICRSTEFQKQIKNEYLVENYVRILKER